jgi:catechol 2,3-dioxygenase-like lactoylglutathione lyase family enzyme
MCHARSIYRIGTDGSRHTSDVTTTRLVPARANGSSSPVCCAQGITPEHDSGTVPAAISIRARCILSAVEEQRRRIMPARIKHVAISSNTRGTLGTFYQSLFGMKSFSGGEGNAMTDGYVGLNVNGRGAGRQAGFDHFGFEERHRFQLTDGVVTLMIAPWRIADYAGTGIERPALDHLGFDVESLQQFQADLAALAEQHPELTPSPTSGHPEREARRKLSETCPFGQYHLADPDGVLLDISAA